MAKDKVNGATADDVSVEAAASPVAAPLDKEAFIAKYAAGKDEKALLARLLESGGDVVGQFGQGGVHTEQLALDVAGLN